MAEGNSNSKVKENSDWNKKLDSSAQFGEFRTSRESTNERNGIEVEVEKDRGNLSDNDHKNVEKEVGNQLVNEGDRVEVEAEEESNLSGNDQKKVEKEKRNLVVNNGDRMEVEAGEERNLSGNDRKKVEKEVGNLQVNEGNRKEVQLAEGNLLSNDRNKMKHENIGNPLDGNSEEQNPEQVSIYQFSPKVKKLIKTEHEFMRKIQSFLGEREDLIADKDFVNKFENSIKFFKHHDVDIISPDSNELSWLNENVAEWKAWIKNCQEKFCCIIFYEEDFSKIYVCTETLGSPSNFSEISKFLNLSPSDIEISHYVREFLYDKERYSDLKVDKKVVDKFCIQGIQNKRLDELKEEFRKVFCESYILDENQYESLLGEKKDVLSGVQKNFQVKGIPYQAPFLEIPVIFQVTSMVGISCILDSDTKNIPIDSLITVDVEEPESKSFKVIHNEKKEHYKIFENQSWDLPTNHHIIHVPEITKRGTTYSWYHLFEKCLTIVLKNDVSSHTIGISISNKILEYLTEVVESIFTMFKGLPQVFKRPVYVLLFVKNDEIKNNAIKILRTLIAAKKQLQTPSGPTQAEFIVEVKEGSIAEEKVDAIVCSTNKSLNLKGGVATALSKKAGPGLEKECNGKQTEFPEILITNGHNLLCKHVFFGALPSYVQNHQQHICTFVKNCLQRADEKGFSSIAFPALGTGNLYYLSQEAATQMARAITEFKNQTRKSSLEKIIIVVYPGTKDKEYFFKSFPKDEDSKGAIPKRDVKSPPNRSQTEEYRQLQWIQFFNYSTKKEKMDEAIKDFEKRLKNVTFEISSEKAKELHYFYELLPLVPDIVPQLVSGSDHLLVPNNSSDQFTTYLAEYNDLHKAVLNIPTSIEISHLKFYRQKLNQQYPKVRVEINYDDRKVLFKSPSFEYAEGAKYQFECLLGLRQIVSASQDRFTMSKQETPGLDRVNASSSYSFGQEDMNHEHLTSTLTKEGYNQNYSPSDDRFNIKKQETSPYNRAYSPLSSSVDPEKMSAPASNYKEINDSDCFKTENGLIVKVYEDNILKVNVDGIVNAANKWLSHGAGVARAIALAAGDIINIEGKRKLYGRTLNDGEVLSTSAGNLKRYKNIIHAVGPIYRTSNNSKDYCKTKIKQAVLNSLKEADKLGLVSIALPAISSAIFGVPLDICTEGYFLGVNEFSKGMSQNCHLKEVHFVDLSKSTIKAIRDFFAEKLSIEDYTQNLPNQRKHDHKTEQCPICLEEMPNPHQLKCNHSLCIECKKKLTQPVCPVCRVPYGVVHGDQPDGDMTVSESSRSLNGFPGTKTHDITYKIGSWSNRTQRYAYLPINPDGDVILKMLQLAFKRRLIFTVGESRTSGAQNVITWNDIHHKTNLSGGPQNYGYPDPEYFDRVKEELANKGITPESVTNEYIRKYIKIQNGKVVPGY